LEVCSASNAWESADWCLRACSPETWSNDFLRGVFGNALGLRLDRDGLCLMGDAFWRRVLL
jgi:hypothetical protein